jgi:serine/threonine protein kinase
MCFCARGAYAAVYFCNTACRCSQGSFGEVYKAKDRRAGDVVAIKIIPLESTGIIPGNVRKVRPQYLSIY